MVQWLNKGHRAPEDIIKIYETIKWNHDDKASSTRICDEDYSEFQSMKPGFLLIPTVRR